MSLIDLGIAEIKKQFVKDNKLLLLCIINLIKQPPSELIQLLLLTELLNILSIRFRRLIS